MSEKASPFLLLYDEARDRGKRMKVFTLPKENAPAVVSEIAVEHTARALKSDLSLRQGLDDAAVRLREKLGW